MSSQFPLLYQLVMLLALSLRKLFECSRSETFCNFKCPRRRMDYYNLKINLLYSYNTCCQHFIFGHFSSVPLLPFCNPQIQTAYYPEIFRIGISTQCFVSLKINSVIFLIILLQSQLQKSCDYMNLSFCLKIISSSHC